MNSFLLNCLEKQSVLMLKFNPSALETKIIISIFIVFTISPLEGNKQFNFFQISGKHNF